MKGVMEGLVMEVEEAGVDSAVAVVVLPPLPRRFSFSSASHHPNKTREMQESGGGKIDHQHRR